jgi:hypothetical protein
MSEEHGYGDGALEPVPLEARGVEPEPTPAIRFTRGDTALPTREPLDIVAGKILGLLDDHEPEDRRLAAAQLLKQAQERIEAGEDSRFPTFKVWWQEKLPGRSARDIRRLLAYANAPDPKAAIAEARAKTAEQTRQYRARADSQSASESATSAVDDEATEESKDIQDKYVETDLEDLDEDPNELQEDPIVDGGDDPDPIFERCLEFLHRQRHRALEIRVEMALKLLEALEVPVAAVTQQTGG